MESYKREGTLILSYQLAMVIETKQQKIIHYVFFFFFSKQ